MVTAGGVPPNVAYGRAPAQWTTVWPFLCSFAFTFAPTLGLLIYLLKTRVATVTGTCDGNDPTNACGVLGNVVIKGRNLIITEPVGRFLTVTKVVDTIQNLAITFVLALAAFPIARTWIHASDLTTHSLAMVTNMYASGRWWALWEASRSMLRKPSKAFVQAFVMLLIALGLSKLATAADLWLHYSTQEASFVLTNNFTPRTLSGKDFGRQVNTSCEPPDQYHSPYASCLMNPSALGSDIFSWPAQALSLATNASTSDLIELVFDPVTQFNLTNGNFTTPDNTAIVVPARTESGLAYNASTVGISASCHAISTPCRLLNVAHGSGSYNCTAAGYNYTGYFASPSPGSVEPYFPDYATNTSTFEAVYLMAIVSGNGSDFQASGYTTAYAIMEACRVQAWQVEYESRQYNDANLQSQKRILSRTPLRGNDSDTILSVVAASLQPIKDALSASRGAAQISGETFSHTLSYELARFSLAYAAKGWYDTSALEVTSLPDVQPYTIVPLGPLAWFFAMVFSYSVFVVILFVWAFPRHAVVHDDNRKISLEHLVQRRLVRTDFLLYQLLSEDGAKSTETDADQIMRGESGTVVVPDYVGGRFGLYPANGSKAEELEQRRTSIRRAVATASRKPSTTAGRAPSRKQSIATTDSSSPTSILRLPTFRLDKDGKPV